MAYNATYKGTKITGTSKSGKKFPKSGIKKAAVGQTYLNTSSGHVYKCVDEGSPKQAKWAYQKTVVVKAPSKKVTSLGSPARDDGTLVMNSAWKVPNELDSADRGDRATKLAVFYGLGVRTGWMSYDLDVESKSLGTGTTSQAIDIGKLKPQGTDPFNGATGRARFYPLTQHQLWNYHFSIAAFNDYGYGPEASSKLSFQPPLPPAVSALSMNKQSKVVSCTVTPSANAGANERYDTRVVKTVYNSRTGTTSVSDTSTPGDGAITVAHTASDIGQLSYGQYISVNVKACCRGLAGDSAWVENTMVVGWPAQPTITDVRVPSMAGDDVVTVDIRTNATRMQPVDFVRLYMLHDTNKKTAEQAKASTDWRALASIGDGTCTALCAKVSELAPSAGRFTWVMAYAWNDVEDEFFRTSEPFRLTALETPLQTSADDRVSIISATPNADGKSATLHLGWDAPDPSDPSWEDDSTHTEVSWATSADAWSSTDRPDTFDMDDETWDEGPVTVDALYVAVVGDYRESGYGPVPHAVTLDETPGSIAVVVANGDVLQAGAGYTVSGKVVTIRSATGGRVTSYSIEYRVSKAFRSSATVVIKGLDEGETCFARARRWQQVDETRATSYGPYSSAKAFLPASSPSSVVLAAPPYIPRGNGAKFSWAYDATAPQKSWRLMKQAGAFQDGNADLVIASGTDPIGSCRVAWEDVDAMAEDGILGVYLAMSTGGSEVVSLTHRCAVVDPPTLAVGEMAQLSAQPLVLPLKCDQQDAIVSIVVSSKGAHVEKPNGSVVQAEGETVWSDVLDPAWEWSMDDSAYRAYVRAPGGLAIHDLCAYEVHVVAKSPVTGLESAVVSAEFSVAWAHQAVLPPADRYFETPDSEVSEGKEYYERVGGGTEDDPYAYVAVEEPQGDPHALGYFEMTPGVAVEPYDETDGDSMRRIGAIVRMNGAYSYEQTRDTEVVGGKTYYEETEGGYAPVAPEGGDDPSAMGWFERSAACPDGAADSDVLDLYRVTPDGIDLVASGLELDAVVDDPYAPYGDADLRYLVSLRTADGDEEWASAEYGIDVGCARFDWEGRYFEIDYNLVSEDSFEKSVEMVTHLDGSQAAGVNPGVERTGSVSGIIVKAGSHAAIEALRGLAQHPGTALVRIPNGCCYEAIVQAPQIGGEFALPYDAVALKATRVDLGAGFKAAPQAGGQP